MGRCNGKRIQSNIWVLLGFGHSVEFIILAPHRFYEFRDTCGMFWFFVISGSMGYVGVAHVSFFTQMEQSTLRAYILVSQMSYES